MHAPTSPLRSSNGAAILPGTEGYENHLVHTAQELVREIARLFEQAAAQKDEDEKPVTPNAKFNANRAWESLNALGRIEL